MQGVAARPAHPVSRPAWAIRIAGTAIVLAIGIGIGTWLGGSIQPQTPLPAAVAPDARENSPPGELQLRMDRDFEKFQPRPR